MFIIDVPQVDLLVFRFFFIRVYIINLHHDGVKEILRDKFKTSLFNSISDDLRQQSHPLCNILQTLWPMINRVHGSHVGQQCLGRTNI